MSTSMYIIYSPLAFSARKCRAADFVREPSYNVAKGNDPRVRISSGGEPSETKTSTSNLRYIWLARDRRQMPRSDGSASCESGSVTETRGSALGSLPISSAMQAQQDALNNERGDRTRPALDRGRKPMKGLSFAGFTAAAHSGRPMARTLGFEGQFGIILEGSRG